MKKIIKNLILFLIIFIGAFLIWYFLSRGESTAPMGQTILNVLPFGSDNSSDLTVKDNSFANTVATSSDTTQDIKVSKLFQLASTPVAGSVVFQRKLNPVVRYVDRATGHIFEVVLPSGTSTAPKISRVRLTNKTLPKVYEAYFRLDGAAVLIRTLKDNTDTIENIALTLKAPGATSTGENLYSTSATLLRGDIDAVTVGGGNSLFYSLKDANAIASSAFDNTVTKTLFTSSFNNWRVTSAGNNLVVYTKADSQVPGYAYKLSTSGGNLLRVAGPLRGLVALPNATGNRVLYSYNIGAVEKLSSLNSTSGEVSDISPATIAEKCVWGIKNTINIFCAVPISDISSNEPENWYKGQTHFSDRIWKFESNGEVAQVLVEPMSTVGVTVDAMNLTLSPNEDYLIFTNKNDLSLWALKL